MGDKWRNTTTDKQGESGSVGAKVTQCRGPADAPQSADGIGLVAVVTTRRGVYARRRRRRTLVVSAAAASTAIVVNRVALSCRRHCVRNFRSPWW